MTRIALPVLLLFAACDVFAQTQAQPGVERVKPPTPARSGVQIAKPSISGLPDLQITEIRYGSSKCSVFVRVVNHGSAGAGEFNVWTQYEGLDKRDVRSVANLPRTKDKWIEFSIFVASFGGSSCPREKLSGVTAVADAGFLRSAFYETGSLYRVGTAVPKGFKAIWPKVDESIETNNHKTVASADLKLYP